MTAKPPAPLEWHPFYRDKTYLLDWLKPNGSQVIRVPIPPVIRLDMPESEDGPNIATLTKQRAWAQAPWTERPYVYLWYVGTDQWGRSIAGEPEARYPEDEMPW